MTQLVRRIGAANVSTGVILHALQAACLVAAPLIFLAVLNGTTRWADRPLDVLFGVLLGAIVALSLVSLGLLVPLAGRRRS